jgi:hypothetical protein
MKKLLFTLLISITTLAYSQAPQQISYQGVARSTSGTVLANQPIGIRFEIHQGSASGTIVFTETHTGVSTNAFGLFTTYIGSINNLSVINWATNSYFIEVSIDPNIGTFSSLGSQQLMSVPYALNAGSAPAPVVSFSNNILSVGGNTATISAGTTYSAGTGIDITGGVISGTANIVGTGATTVNGIYPNLTINTPTTQVYSAGLGIDISSSGVISNTAAAASPTITSSGVANVTNPTTNTYIVDVPAPTINYNSGTNELTLAQNGSVSTATLNGTGSSTTSIVGTGLATVTPTIGSTFTVNVPAQTLSVNNGSLTISGPGGNTVALDAYTGGTGISITGSAPNYVINNTTPAAVTQTLVGTGISSVTPGANTFTVNTPMPIYTANTGVLSFGGTNTVVATPSLSIIGNVVRSGPASNTITIPASVITGAGTGIATVTTAVNNFTVNVPSPTYNTATGVLAFGTSTVNAVPTLSLTGNTLSSGPGGNSVNLASLPGLWSASSTTAIIQTNTTNNVGIGMTSPAPQFKLDVVATAGNSVTIHGLNSGTTDAFAGVYGENTSSGIGVYAQSNSGKGVFGKSTSGSGVYGESTSGDAGKFNMTGTGSSFGVQVQTMGTGAALFARSNYTPNPMAAKLEGNVDIQNTGSVTGRLINAVHTNSVSDGFGLDVTNPNNMGNALQINTVGKGSAGYFTVNNTSNGSNAINAVTNGSGNAGFFAVTNTVTTNHAVQGNSSGLSSAIFASNTNTTSTGSHALLANAAAGSAVYAVNTSSNAATINATNSGTGDVIYANANDGIAFYGANTSSSSKSVMELASNGDGSALQVYKNAGSTGYVASFLNSAASNPSNAVIVSSTGAAHSLYSANSNASVNAYAGLFDGGLVSKGKTNTSAAFSFKAFDNSSAELFGVRNDGHVGINATSPAHRLTVVETSAANAAIFASNVSVAANASGHGIMGITSNSHALAAAVFGQNSGSGPSIYGVKSPSETGIAGRFELMNTINTADAVFAKTDGSGAAVHAVSGSTGNTLSNVSLWVENGHIKATGANPTITSTITSLQSYAVIGTDVAGKLSVLTSTLTGVPAGQDILQVTFSKAYAAGAVPVIILTNTSPNSFSVQAYVSGVTNTGFKVRFNAAPNLNTSYSFNYMVIE